MGISIDDSEVVCSFIANEISLGNYHGLFRGIARLLQFFGGGVWIFTRVNKKVWGK